MNQQQFERLKQAVTKGQFKTFLDIASIENMDALNDAEQRNWWLLYSELLQRSVGPESIPSKKKLQSFAHNSERLMDLFVALPPISSHFFVMRAVEAFVYAHHNGAPSINVQRIVDHTHNLNMNDGPGLTGSAVETLAWLFTHARSTPDIAVLMEQYCAPLTADDAKILISGMRFERGALFLPFVSFDFDESQWKGHHSASIQALRERAVQRQRQRLMDEIPPGVLQSNVSALRKI